jgi:DNA-binding TFAR19-related protein (PDSD5 family)
VSELVLEEGIHTDVHCEASLVYLKEEHDFNEKRFAKIVEEIDVHANKQRKRIVSSGMLSRVALVRTDVSEELSAYFIRMTRIGELGTTPTHGC